MIDKSIGATIGLNSFMAERKEDGGHVVWSDWQDAQEAIALSRLGVKGGGARLIITAFVHRWNPAAMQIALHLVAAREQAEFSFASFFLVDADRDADKCKEFGIKLTPGVLLFWDGDPLTIRRGTWDDDEKSACAYARQGVSGLPSLHGVVRARRAVLGCFTRENVSALNVDRTGRRPDRRSRVRECDLLHEGSCARLSVVLRPCVKQHHAFRIGAAASHASARPARRVVSNFDGVRYRHPYVLTHYGKDA